MAKNKLLFVLLALALVAAVFFLSKDWFRKDEIQIGFTIRPNRLSERQQRRLGPALKDPTYTVCFFFDRKCKLESLRVVNADELKTNRFARPLWALVSDSNSIPVKTIIYGVPVRGMRTEVRGAQADILQPGIPYRLLVRTTKQEAHYDFTLGAK